MGFAHLFHDDDDWAAVTELRRFSFTEESRYRALLTGAPQYNTIASYEQANDVPVCYLLYNPWKLPSSVVVPLVGDMELTGPCEVGCRVVPARQLHTTLADQAPGHSPAYRDLHNSLGEPSTPAAHPAGWRLEHFVSDLLLECHTGYIAESRADRGARLHLHPPQRPDRGGHRSHTRRAVSRSQTVRTTYFALDPRADHCGAAQGWPPIRS